MATAAPDLGIRMALSAGVWVLVGAAALNWLPPDGSAGVVMAILWCLLWALCRPAHEGAWRAGAVGLCGAHGQTRPSDWAMGWMMGTLWWHTQGCLLQGWPPQALVLIHLLAMALMVVAVQRMREPLQSWLALAGWTLAALAPLLGGEAVQSLVLMAGVTLAWSAQTGPQQVRPLRASLLGLAFLPGPLGLIWIHAQWPTQGGAVLGQALWLLAVSVLCVQLGAMALRKARSLSRELLYEQHGH